MKPIIKHGLIWLLSLGIWSYTLPAADAHALKPLVLNLSGTETGVWTIRLLEGTNETQLAGVTAKIECGPVAADIPLDMLRLKRVQPIECNEHPLRTIAIEGLATQLLEVIVRIQPHSEAATTHLLSSGNTELQLQSVTPTLPTYLTLGVQHLLTGFDHILFVLLLLIVVRDWRSLVMVITSFTIAHSITLGLSTLELVNISQQWVEIVIALSIVLLAREALSERHTLSRRHPWLIAFGFGLIHGLGFAGALKDIGLPEDAVFMSLLLFNVGIEIGQLGIAVIALLIRSVAARVRAKLALRLDQGLALTAGSFGLYWMLSRSLLGL